MSRWWTISGVILVLVIGGIFLFSKFHQNSSSAKMQRPQYTFVEEYKTIDHSFSCYIRLYTESNCELYIADASGNNPKDLGISVDYGDFGKKIQASPDGKNLLITLEHEAIVLNTTTLIQKVVLNAPTGDALGTYDAFPSFIPYAKWMNNSQVRISVFKQDTPEPDQGEPAAVPLETRSISI